MGVTTPYRVLLNGRVIGNMLLREAAEQLISRRAGFALIIDERDGRRFIRRDGQWIDDGFDRKTAAAAAARRAGAATLRDAG